MSRWLTTGVAAAVVVMLAVAALWSPAPPAARAQTAPDVRLREPAPTPTPAVGQSAGPTPLTLRISSATLEEDGRALADGVDLTLLAQPTYVALPSAGPNLLRISPAITITARDASGRATRLSDAARLRFRQLGAAPASVYRLDIGIWRPLEAVTQGQALVVQPATPGTYAVFAELPPDWPLRHDALAAVALNAARLVVDDLAAQPWVVGHFELGDRGQSVDSVDNAWA